MSATQTKGNEMYRVYMTISGIVSETHDFETQTDALRYAATLIKCGFVAWVE